MGSSFFSDEYRDIDLLIVSECGDDIVSLLEQNGWSVRVLKDVVHLRKDMFDVHVCPSDSSTLRWYRKTHQFFVENPSKAQEYSEMKKQNEGKTLFYKKYKEEILALDLDSCVALVKRKNNL